MLHDMLNMAGYPDDSIALHTDFFRGSVAPSLGPHPRGTGEPEIWKSFMTDDHTPVEVSWCWSTSLETPTVRYSAEPIGKLAGQSVDPINTAASLRLLGEALPLSPDMDLYLHRHFQQTLMSRNAPEHVNAKDTPLSQSFIAFDLLKENVVVKQYYLPGWRALREGKSKFALVEEAIRSLPVLANPLLESFDVFVGFLESFSSETRPVVEILAIDCVDPVQSRLKIYVRFHETTLRSVMDMMTLGGLAPKTQEEENSLRELWCSVFGLDEEKDWDNQSLPQKDHHTGGILYYYEFKCGMSVPKTKVYLPVRHYAQNDDQIARGLSQYLDRRDKRLITGSYYEGVQRLWYVYLDEDIFTLIVSTDKIINSKHRSLASGLGFHTYICWASEKNLWNVTAYFNPEIYSPSRQTF